VPAIPLIHCDALHPLLDFAARAGVVVPESLARMEARLREPRSLIPLALAGQLVEEVARANGDDALGLRLGEQLRLDSLDDSGWLTRCARTVGEAFEAGMRQGSLFNTGQRYSMGFLGDDVWFRWTLAAALRRGRQQINDFTLMLVVKTIRLGAGAHWRPAEIQFEGPMPSHADQLATLAERVRFGESSTSLLFPRRVLAASIRPASTLPLPPSRTSPRSSLPARDFPGSVRQTIASLLRFGSPKLAVAAEMSGMSARSLQRRLHESRLDFGRLVEEARLESARRLLEEPERKIIDVAAELGYTDSANFTRAFRRWTGVSPREFRRTLPAP
jgi:AraC-like DNA-binding protein